MVNPSSPRGTPLWGIGSAMDCFRGSTNRAPSAFVFRTGSTSRSQSGEWNFQKAQCIWESSAMPAPGSPRSAVALLCGHIEDSGSLGQRVLPPEPQPPGSPAALACAMFTHLLSLARQFARFKAAKAILSYFTWKLAVTPKSRGQ